MGLNIMTVGSETNKPSGTVSPVKPYEFLAYLGDTWRTVKIVMPLGGVESGLFRYPIPGEKVLVGDDAVQYPAPASTTYYLMGYVPDVTQPFSAAAGAEGTGNGNLTLKEVINKQGQVFRYRNTAKQVMPGDYSEIGYYNKPTQWTSPDKILSEIPIVESSKLDIGEDIKGYRITCDRGQTPPKYTGGRDGTTAITDSKDIAKIEKWFKDNIPCPDIDHLNIQSTGDIYSSAQNHHRAKAKRFELLVDCDGPNYTKNPDDYGWDDWAFGDRSGDDPNLYAGDAHIRAKNRIVIKAGDEIRLEVGRSSIVISDKGIAIASRKTRSHIENPWDTVINMTPLGGIKMFGQDVTIKAADEFILTENFGGKVSSKWGITRIYSKDFKAFSCAAEAYHVTGGFNIANYFNIISSMLAGSVIGVGDRGVQKGKGIKQGSSGIGNSIPYYMGLGADVIGLIANINMGYGLADNREGNDPMEGYVSTLGVIQTIIKVVAIVVESTIPKKNLEQYGGRDGLIATVSIVDAGINVAAFANLVIGLETLRNMLSATAQFEITPLHTSYLHLTGAAGIRLEGAYSEDRAVAHVKTEGPTAGFETCLIKQHAWKAGIGGIAVALVGIAGAITYAKTGIFNFLEYNEEELEKLKEL
jgi:hypothetical protein